MSVKCCLCGEPMGNSYVGAVKHQRCLKAERKGGVAELEKIKDLIEINMHNSFNRFSNKDVPEYITSYETGELIRNIKQYRRMLNYE